MPEKEKVLKGMYDKAPLDHSSEIRTLTHTKVYSDPNIAHTCTIKPLGRGSTRRLGSIVYKYSTIQF